MQTKREIDRYLRTGEYGDLFPKGSWSDFFEQAKNDRVVLRTALVNAVRQRTVHATVLKALAGLDVVAFARAKVAPMVQGLFPKSEQDAAPGVRLPVACPV